MRARWTQDEAGRKSNPNAAARPARLARLPAEKPDRVSRGVLGEGAPSRFA